MDTTIKQRWVDALRSGKYRQATSSLRSLQDGYCCLGVLCDLMQPEGWYKNIVWYHRGCGGLPHGQVQDEAGLSGGMVEILTRMNDTGRSFTEIADYIERKA